MYWFWKRFFDIILSATTILVLSPILLLIALLLRFTGEGEVFFRQERLGWKGRRFRALKFVTMRKDSPMSGTITAKGDPRILPVGRFLRTSKINEIPQLWNIILGEMSIVGPRPLTQEAFELYPDAVKPLIYESKPGLTGIGSVAFRHEEDILARSKKDRIACYREDIMPIKGALEVWYGRHIGLYTDLKIVILTVLAILIPGNRLHLGWFKDFPESASVL